MKYYAYLTASKNNLLLGGVKHHQAGPFQSSSEASDWLTQAIEINTKAHVSIAAWGTEARGGLDT